MGRKGVSKRKPVQAKATPMAKGSAKDGVSTVGKALSSQLVKRTETSKDVVRNNRGDDKTSPKSGKLSKKH